LRFSTSPSTTSFTLPANVAADLARSKAELILENAFLHQQFIVLARQANRPALKSREWVLLVLLSSKLRTTWKQALLTVQPDTLQRSHLGIFRWLWKRKSRPKQRPGRLTMSC
jgi:hypothetical protein